MPPPPPRPRVTFRIASAMLWRALTLRCPHCGSRGIFADWFHLKEHCPRCKLHLHRQESDYFLGAYMIMLFIMESVFALGFLVTLLITWPNPPWEAIQWIGAVVLIAGILLAYPFAKTLWLAIDLIFRPVSSSELGWHAGEPEMSDHDARR